VRKLVFKQIDQAKRANRVAGIADAVVTIEATGKTLQVLRGLHDEHAQGPARSTQSTHSSVGAAGARLARSTSSMLEDVMMCSELKLVDATGQACGATEPLPGAEPLLGVVAVRVEQAVLHKCDRCWRFAAPTTDELCLRCHTVVADATTA
jgi:hypothetical protein